MSTELSCKEFAVMGRNIPVPCTISLDSANQDSELLLLEIIRVVPGKRLIGLAQWNGQQRIAKIFFHPRHWRRNRLHDLKGVNYLKAHKLPAPELVHQTTCADGAGAVLLFARLTQGANLREVFDSQELQSVESQLNLLRLTIATISDCHKAGIWQKDLHLENFYYSNGEIQLLDGGNIQHSAKALGFETKLSNLAQFVSQFPVQFSQHHEFILNTYKDMNANFPNGVEPYFNQLVLKARNNRLDHFERKIFRSTTAFKRVKTISKRFVYERALQCDELYDLIENPDLFIDKGKILKDGDTTTVAEVTIDGKKLVLKRYNITGFWQGLRRMFQVSRAHHSWRNASMLIMLGIPTPQPFLFMEERRFWWFKHKAYFLSEQIESEHLMFQLQENAAIKDYQLTESFRQFFQAMWDYKISHGDMKASNFIYRNNKLYVLDLDAMKRHSFKFFFKRKAKKDLIRFERNWQGSRFEGVFAPMIRELHYAKRK